MSGNGMNTQIHLPSTSNFYSSKQQRQWSGIKRLLSEKESQYRREKIPKPYKNSLTGPSSVWKVFYRQNDAFKFAHGHSGDLFVVAFESAVADNCSGQRRYLVTELPVFWHFYQQLEADRRNHYEIIHEGAVCKLYFDLEYKMAENKKHDGNKMVDILIKYVAYWLKKEFGITTNRTHVLDLDASTAKKFSRHLVYSLPNAAFKDNIHAGNFVHHIMDQLMKLLTQQTSSVVVSDLAQWDVTVDDLKTLLVDDGDGRETLFCDLGVYTKNRNFRLYLSSKLHKNNPLVVSGQNTFKFDAVNSTPSKQREERIFLQSLICNVKYKENMKILCNQSNRLTGVKGTGQRKDNCADTTDVIEGHTQSPYLEIDQFIHNIINSCGVKGQIRQWVYFPQGETILYEIQNHRWCWNIERHHKSNNIMLLVDLKAGIFYQKCHDPDCKASNFRSNDFPLPKEILPSAFFDEDAFEEEMEDEDLYLAAAEAELTIENSSRLCPDSDFNQNCDSDTSCSNDVNIRVVSPEVEQDLACISSQVTSPERSDKGSMEDIWSDDEDFKDDSLASY